MQKVLVSSNESLDKPVLKELISYYPEANVKIVPLKIGDIVKGNVCIELKTAPDFLSSLKKERGATVPRMLRQSYNMGNNYKYSFIIITATIPEIVLETRRRVVEDEPSWNLNSLYGYMASIQVRYNVTIVPFGALGASRFIFSLLEKGNDGKTPSLNLLGASAKGKDSQVAMLSQIPGVGNEVAKELLKNNHTIKNIMSASMPRLKKSSGVGDKLSKTIWELSRKTYKNEE